MAARRKKRRGIKRKKSPVRKKHGKKAKGTKGARMLILNPAQDVWDVQKALRKDKYFAVAKGQSKILTNAPITRI